MTLEDLHHMVATTGSEFGFDAEMEITLPELDVFHESWQQFIN